MAVPWEPQILGSSSAVIPDRLTGNPQSKIRLLPVFIVAFAHPEGRKPPGEEIDFPRYGRLSQNHWIRYPTAGAA